MKNPSQSHSAASLAIAACFAMALAGALRSQCTTAWLPGLGLRGANNVVQCACEWNHGGTTELVVGGQFTDIGGVPALHIARWDGSAWHALGAGLDQAGYSDVHAMITLPNGDLVVGGYFSFAGALPVNCLARWDGQSWHALGSGTNGAVYALATMPNGDVVAGGAFTTAGGVAATGIARWDGTAWAPLGAGVAAPVRALVVMPNGNLIAGGDFQFAGGVLAPCVAAWDGSNWSSLGGSVASGSVTSLAYANGRLAVGGTFTSVGGIAAANVAVWDGVGWTALGAGAASRVAAVHWLANGNLAIALSGVALGPMALLEWDGVGWTSWASSNASSGYGVIATMARFGNDTVVGGLFAFNGVPGRNLVVRSNAWSTLGSGFDRHINGMTVLANGDVLVCGPFASAGGTTADLVARWDGAAWSGIGSLAPLPLFPSLPTYAYLIPPLWLVNAVAEMPNGDIAVAGGFVQIGGVAALRVARWDGTAWSSFGPGIGNPLSVAPTTCLLAMPNGDLIAGGNFGVVRWNGSGWSGQLTGNACSLRKLPNGNLLATGNFTNASVLYACAAIWDGANWTLLGSATNGTAYASAVLPNGDIVVGGSISAIAGVTVNNIARWDGTTWSPVGAGVGGTVRAMLTLPNGDLLVGGTFTMAGGAPAGYLARWDGSVWSRLPNEVDGPVYALAMRGDEVLAGGDFRRVGTTASASFARLASTCPASTSLGGAGCTGAGGPNSLAASSLPWLGAPFTTHAGGLAANSIAVEVRGLGAIATPLSQVLGSALPGCSLLVTPDLLGLYLTGSGQFDVSVAIPSAASLIGQVLHQQVVGVELDALGTITGFTSSNRVSATIGMF